MVRHDTICQTPRLQIPKWLIISNFEAPRSRLQAHTYAGTDMLVSVHLTFYCARAGCGKQDPSNQNPMNPKLKLKPRNPILFHYYNHPTTDIQLQPMEVFDHDQPMEGVPKNILDTTGVHLSQHTIGPRRAVCIE